VRAAKICARLASTASTSRASAAICASRSPRRHAARLRAYDLILFCVKAYDTDTAAQAISNASSGRRDSDSAERRRERGEARRNIRPDAVMGGNARVGVEMVAPGKSFISAPATLTSENSMAARPIE